jgi:hypothetical protein
VGTRVHVHDLYAYGKYLLIHLQMLVFLLAAQDLYIQYMTFSISFQTVPKKPDIVTLSDAMWLSVNFIATKFNNFEGMLLDAVLKICIRIEDFEQVSNH